MEGGRNGTAPATVVGSVTDHQCCRTVDRDQNLKCFLPTERVGIGAEPETFVTPAHSIPPLVPPSAPIVPLAATASRHPTATWIALSA